jgi:hypothetical protein
LEPEQWSEVAAALAIKVVESLGGSFSDAACCIFYVSGNAVCGSFIGKLVVSGKLAYALLDSAREGAYLAFSLFFCAPAKGLASGALDAIVASGVIRFRSSTIEQKNSHSNPYSNAGNNPGKCSHQ